MDEPLMAALGRIEIEEAMHAEDLDERLIITPLLDPKQVGRGAVDLRLGTDFLLLRQTLRSGIDPSLCTQAEIDSMQERVIVPFGGELWLHPHHCILAATLEFIALPDDLCATVVGRSSWGRLGLIVATAVLVHPGFHGCLTLELVNEGNSPIALCPGARVAQLALQRLREPAQEVSGEDQKYTATVRPHPSRLAAEQGELQQLASLGGRLRSRLG
jgi:dCTP deaminase